MMMLSVIIGASCGSIGIYASYYVDIASGASIVLVATGAFVAAMLYSSVRNRLDDRARTRGPERRRATERDRREVIYD